MSFAPSAERFVVSMNRSLVFTILTWAVLGMEFLEVLWSLYGWMYAVNAYSMGDKVSQERLGIIWVGVSLMLFGATIVMLVRKKRK